VVQLRSLFLWVCCFHFRTTCQSHLQVSINCLDMSVTNYQPNASHSDMFDVFYKVAHSLHFLDQCTQFILLSNCAVLIICGY